MEKIHEGTGSGTVAELLEGRLREACIELGRWIAENDHNKAVDFCRVCKMENPPCLEGDNLEGTGCKHVEYILRKDNVDILKDQVAKAERKQR